MDADEARDMARAINDVNRHYNYRLLDQKSHDWFNLIMFAGACYGGRVMAIRERLKTSKRGNIVVREPPPTDHVGQVAPREMRAATIPGMGTVEFPPDHPLAPKSVN